MENNVPKSNLESIQNHKKQQLSSLVIRKSQIRHGDSARNRNFMPYISITSQPDKNFQRYAAHFAYELNYIIIPKKGEENEYGKVLYKWNENLVKVLNLFDDKVIFRLRYLNEPVSKLKEQPKLKIMLLISVLDEKKKNARAKAMSLIKELSMLFSQPVFKSIPIYNFKAITNRDDLIHCMLPVKFHQVTHFSRKASTLNDSKIGFLRDLEVETNKSKAVIPINIQLPPSMVELCNSLINYKDKKMLQIMIRPHRLNLRDLALQRKNYLAEILKNEILTQDEIIYAEQYSKKLMDQAENCFQIQVSLIEEKKCYSTGLISTIIDAFYNQVSKVEINTAPGEIHNTEFQSISSDKFESSSIVWKQIEMNEIYLVDDAVNIFRLPFPQQSGISGIKRSDSSVEYIPKSLSKKGPVLGIKNVNGNNHFIKIDPVDLRRHTYILGQTGTGKTTLLYSMIQERIEAGKGVALIDPHGDLFNKVLKSIPENRLNDIVIFDPTRKRNRFALNMLEFNPAYPEQRTFIVHEMFEIFQEFYHSETMGPMFELYMRNAMLLVMDNPAEPGTLNDVNRVFRDKKFRNKMVHECKDKDVVGFWKEIAEAASYEMSLKNMAPYIVSKLNRFVQNDYLQPIIKQRHSSVNFRELIDINKIFLAKLPKGRIGNLGVKLLGTILFNKIFMSALSREDIAESRRKDFTLFVDEFQNFTSNSIASMLSEARKYRLNLVLANQTLGQIKQDILQAVLGNVGSLIFFRPGIQDAEKIKDYVQPNFTKEEMIDLSNYTAIGRLQAKGVPLKPFLFNTVLS